MTSEEFNTLMQAIKELSEQQKEFSVGLNELSGQQKELSDHQKDMQKDMNTRFDHLDNEMEFIKHKMFENEKDIYNLKRKAF